MWGWRGFFSRIGQPSNINAGEPAALAVLKMIYHTRNLLLNEQKNIMLPKVWLKQFLESKDHTKPDDHPLYRYRMGNDDFESLKITLKTSAMLGVANLINVTGWNAAFVIYAAEWWRREYDGSSWKWENLFKSFGADVNELSTTQRNLIVETGLRYWRRDVKIINGSSRYLGTIATEGGLPLNQLKNAKNDWLSRVFKQVIPKFTRLQQTGIDAAELIAECEYIPKTYRSQREIHAILGDMVTMVVNLKREYQLQDRDKPDSYLDEHAPAWRDRFPLPIDDTVGAALLSDMIATAAKADDTLAMPMRSNRRLGDDGSVQLQLEFAGFIALENLKFAEAETVPGRVEVELIGSDGTARQLGIALKTNYKQKPSLQMPKRPATIKGGAALLGYSIRFKHLADTLKEIPLIGGEALANDVPWVFVQRDGQWQLAGLASFNTRALQVRVLYSDNWTCEHTDGQSLPTTMPNTALLEASGTLRLSDNEGNIFTIKTAQTRASDYYYLEGKKLGFASNPSESYIGLPTLRCTDPETGNSQTIPAAKLTARPVNSKQIWQPLAYIMRGIYEIRLVEQGAIVFRKKCVLLPETFAIRFKPSANSLDGTIFFDVIGNAKIICESAIEHNISQENGGYRLDLFADQTPPSQVKVALRWQGMAEMLTLSLPYPARGGQIIDAEGNRQSSGQPMFQDQLHGVRLRLFNEQPNWKRHLQIDFTLVDSSLDDLRDLRFFAKLEKKGAVIELAVIDYLDWIKTLLAVSSNLDSTVQLTVYENGAELLKARIARYAYSLQRILAQGTIGLSQPNHARLSYDVLIGIALKAMRLSQPEQDHIELEVQQSAGTPTGSWLFQPEKRVAEPWLIYPVAKSTLPLRPILWAVGYEPDAPYHSDTDVSVLHSAVKIGPTEARQEAIKRILLAMSKDFSHSGWGYLQQLWRHCPHLPLSSFDVWIIAVTEPQILAALVLQMDAALIEKLTIELPVFWELLPLADWLAVYSAYQEHLKQIGLDEADLPNFMAKRIDKIAAACESLEVVAKILKRSLCGIQHQDLQIRFLSPEQLAQMLGEQRQELDRRQADSDWPTALKQELSSTWQQLNRNQQLGLDLENMSEHHRAVVALPVLLAIRCADTGTLEMDANNAPSIFKLKCLKTFDEDWFNTVFKWALAYLSQQNH